MKKCVTCGKIKQVSDFSLRTFRGRKYPFSYCKMCRASREKAARHKDIQAHREYKKQYYRRDLESNRERSRKYRDANRSQALTALYAWKAENSEKVIAYRKRYLRENKHKFLRYCSERRAAKMFATPEWANRHEIEAIYKMAVGFGMHVDHIVPLKSKIVCGLHVPANLALLTRQENISKGNRRWPDMP